MIPIVIPAYQPEPTLTRLVRDLRALTSAPIVVVNDGSQESCAGIFAAVAQISGVTVLRHAVNLGKGAALKTALNYALCQWPQLTGVVTADADGQHLPADILRVAARLETSPDSLVLGARKFTGKVPLRSLIGNRLTVGVMRLVAGQHLNDTQTGLRAVPRALLPHLLALASNGYEFELDMLLSCKHRGVPIIEEPIETVYLEDNRTSHFNPLTDSLKVYFTLVRFSAISITTTLIDNTVFYLGMHSGLLIWQAQLAARAASVMYNYPMLRRAVFLSREEISATFPRYLALVAASGATSYMLLDFLHEHLRFSVIAAKVTAETVLFFVNFVVSRDFIFTKRAGSPEALG